MMDPIADVTPLQFGLVGFVLLLMWKVLAVGEKLFMKNKTDGGYRRVTSEGFSPLACQIDPNHFTHIKEIHAYTENVMQRINQGDFNCQWRDRDEVRDFIEISRQQLEATKEQTRELQLLRNAITRLQVLNTKAEDNANLR